MYNITEEKEVAGNEIEEQPTQIKPYPEKGPTESIRLKDIPQGSGSKLDSDTIDGLNASTFQNPRPNTLVPLGPDGTLPEAVIPTPTNGLMFLETQSPVASSTFTFAEVLTPGTHYKIIFSMAQNTSNGITYLRFNADSGTNYKWSANAFNTNGASVSASNNGDTEIQISGGTAVGAGDYAVGEIDFNTVPGDNTVVYGTYSNSLSDANPFLVSVAGALKYDGGSDLSSVTILPSAGTITGTFKLYEIS